jgi:hypothetical protein
MGCTGKYGDHEWTNEGTCFYVIVFTLEHIQEGMGMRTSKERRGGLRIDSGERWRAR